MSLSHLTFFLTRRTLVAIRNWVLQRFMIDVYIAEGMVARVSYQRILIGRTIANTVREKTLLIHDEC